jgi:hypothetical protein
MIVVLVQLMCRQSLAFETEIILTQAAFLSVDTTTAVVSLDRAIRYLLRCREARSFLDNCISKVVVVLLYAIDIGGASSLERDRIKSCIRLDWYWMTYRKCVQQVRFVKHFITLSNFCKGRWLQ